MTREEEISFAFKDLYPTGRAWNYIRNNDERVQESTSYTDGIGDEFTDGVGDVFGTTYDIFEKKSKQLQYAYERAFIRTNEKLSKVLDQLLPDNDGFNYDDVLNWERVLEIDNSNLSISDRKEIIYARLGYTNNNPYRQTSEYLQEQLQANGFDLYVHENRVWNGSFFEAININPAKFGEILFGSPYFGSDGILYTSVVKNYIDESIDNGLIVTESYRNKYVIIIGGSSLNTFTSVLYARKNELREIILKHKPLHIAAVMQVNYI